MANTFRLSMIGAVIVCFVGVQGNATLFASEDTSSRETSASAISTDDVPAGTDAPITPSPLLMERARLTLDPGFLAANPSLGTAAPDARAHAFSGQVYRGQPYRIGRSGSIAALMIGAAAAIAGTAILVYANRPDCTNNQFASGCGYGTKVIGGSVLAGGVVGLFIGALTWR